MESKKLNIFNFIGVFLRSFFIQTVWNYQSMQSIGFCFAISPIGKKLYKLVEDRKAFLNRHLNFFNAHPYFSSYALGAISKIEEELSEQKNPDFNQLNRFKNALIGPLGAVGDQLFWATLKPAAILIGLIGVTILTDFYTKIYFLIFILMLYNTPHIYIRIFGIVNGYKHGFQVYKIINIDRYNLIRHIYGILGTTALGIYAGYSLVDYGSANEINSLLFVLGAVLAYSLSKLKISIYKCIIVTLTVGILVGIILEFI